MAAEGTACNVQISASANAGYRGLLHDAPWNHASHHCMHAVVLGETGKEMVRQGTGTGRNAGYEGAWGLTPASLAC